MGNFVQLYKSTDLNAPPLTGQVGSLVTLLNAILVDGFGFSGVSITGITRSGTTATATVSAADGKRLRSGMLLTVSGATGGDASLYNGTFTITVASTTTFTYTMGGTPSGSATGTLLLSALLPVTGIVESGVNYTATLTNADPTLQVGQYITFSGASPGGVNIAMKINTVTDSTHVICMGPGSLGTITGTISYTRSPLGWGKPFGAGTNAQTYRSPDSGSNRFYLQVIDNAATAGLGKEAQIYGAEAMTADQAVSSGQFPTVGQAASGMCCRKSLTADATVREWVLVGDDRTFYFIPDTADTTSFHGIGFGHFISFKAGDGFNTFICGGLTFNSGASSDGLATAGGPSATVLNNFWVTRLYSQTGGSVAGQMVTFSASSPGVTGLSAGAGATVTYPNPADSGFYCVQLLVMDAVGSLRGRMPGFYCPLHVVPFNNYDQVTGVSGLSGITLTALSASSGSSLGQVMVDTFGPWS